MIGKILFYENNEEDYAAAAEWCNQNGAKIVEIEPSPAGVRQFQIVEDIIEPAPVVVPEEGDNENVNG